ncbi:restriction endonuclease subunit S [Vibrio cholerae]|uniref:restriction endonuclease subunit S n=1 Tax=Vibrio cholerae TaxID=666 RepID=UPI000C9B993F|nr:restriction endonuclease subunit S [Vibrio cholerae]EKF9135273.1 restriction endonuclease subunit S [Vibrio cholerae]
MSWALKRLSEVALINPRRPAIVREDSVETSFVPMEAVDEVLGEVTQTLTQPYSKVKKGYTYFEDGDVIFAKITPCMQNGKHAVVSNLSDNYGFGSTEFHVVRPSEDIVSEWIHFYLRRKETLDAAVKTFTGAVGQQRVPASFLENLEIPVPPPDEQLKIVARLKAQLAEVETARQAAQVQLSEASALKKRALETLFASVESWSPIGSAAKLQSGYAFKSDTFKTSGIRLLRNANILPGKVYWDDSVFLNERDAEKYSNFVLHENDVLISLDRPIISSGIKVARVSNDDLPALLVQRVGRFIVDPEKLDKDYLYAFLQTDLFISKITGHDQSLGVPHISPSQVESIEIPLPSPDEQKALAKRLKEITDTWQDLASALQNQVNDLTKLPKAILAKAFEN